MNIIREIHVKSKSNHMSHFAPALFIFRVHANIIPTEPHNNLMKLGRLNIFIFTSYPNEVVPGKKKLVTCPKSQGIRPENRQPDPELSLTKMQTGKQDYMFLVYVCEATRLL